VTNFTLNNHLTYTIGDRLFGHRETSFEKYFVKLGQIDPDQYARSNYVDELHRTAKSVLDEFGKDLVVFVSGGTDSEIVLRNFLAIGHRPRCVTIRFRHDYNALDVAEAVALTTELGLDLEFIDFDVKDFYFSGEAAEFGTSIQCTQITYLMVYKSILDLGAPAVMGGETLLTRKVDADSSYWYYTLRENEDASAMRFTNKYSIPLVNEWFAYTPEVLLYYLENPLIQKLVTDKYNYKLTSVSSKNAILATLYPNIRPKQKTHGFENLLAFNYEAYQSISGLQIKRLEASLDGIEINQAIRMLRGFL